MIGNKYKYGLIDMSYLLSRNVFACARKGVGNFDAGDVIKMTIQTLNKIPRDYGITVDKYILVRDTWAKEFNGYYRTYLLGGKYKDSRVYMTDDMVEEMKKDPSKTEEEIQKAEMDAYINKVKMEAKKGLIYELNKFGVPCVGVSGWEFDDLAWLASCVLYENPAVTGRSPKPNVIITKDSDLQYSISPQMDYFRIPTGGSEPQVITYDEMCQKIPERLKAKGVSLYQYKSFMDSLGEGHNDMRRSLKHGVDPIDAIEHILNEDFSDLEDYDLFVNQYSTFSVEKFPRFQEAKDIVLNQIGKLGKLGTQTEFNTFCDKCGLKEDKYFSREKFFSQFINRFDPKLFSDDE